jgi:hypothetical protein
VKEWVKKRLYQLAPERMTGWMSARARAHSHSMIRFWGHDRLNRLLLENLGNEVLEGPVAGLKLTPMTEKEHLGPYLLGVYESELDGAWQAIQSRTFTQIIDIGAKFGYYAVGLARKYPDARVIAFDTDWWAREAMQEMAQLNAVSNLEICGYCSPKSLLDVIIEPSFILSDCEGYEAILFNAEVISRMGSSVVLIETHDCFVPGVTAKLKDAFTSSHDVELFDEHRGRRKFSGNLDFLSPTEREIANHEVRPSQSWLLCLPKRL